MPSIVNCPSCDRQLRVPDGLVGQKVKCPTCATLFLADEEPPPRPSRRGSPPPDDVPDRPSRRRPEDEYEEDDDRPSRRRPAAKPGKAQAVAVMMLIGGIFAVKLSLGLAVGTLGYCCLWPGTYYSLVLGIMAIIRASAIL